MAFIIAMVTEIGCQNNLENGQWSFLDHLRRLTEKSFCKAQANTKDNLIDDKNYYNKQHIKIFLGYLAVLVSNPLKLIFGPK